MPAAIDLALRVAVVLALAWIAVVALRTRAASVRALVWTIGLGGTLALPFLSQVAPAWTIAVWQAPAPRVEPAPVSPRVMTDLPQRVDDAPIIERASARVAPMETAAPAPAALQPEPVAPVDWTARALFLWAVLTSVLLARIAASHARMNGLLAESGPAVEGWSSLIEELKATRNIRREVQARTTDAISVPAIVGVLRPTLLLPVEADEWDDETSRAVVLHELAHVARWDALAQLVGQIACAVYWFIPLTWHGARRAAALRERASDDEVLRAGVRASAYAERLLDLAKGAGRADMQLATVAMARPSRMRERVVAILDPAARRDALTRPAVAIALMLSATAITAVAAATPTTRPSEPMFVVNADASVGEPARPEQTQAPLARTPRALEASPAPEAATTTEPEPVAATAAIDVAPASGSQTRTGLSAAELCVSEDGNHSHLVGDKNGRSTLTVKISGRRCKVELTAEGKITFNNEFTDVASLDGNGFFRLDVDEGGTRRQLDIESRNGSLERTWRVNGRAQPYDEAARAWFAAFLIALDRRSAIGVDTRLPYLLRQGGVEAVLRETALMTGDYARTAYHTRLAKTRLSAADSARVLEQAATLTKSDHYATELLKTFADHGGLGAPAQRAAIARMIEAMDSDHYRAESIEALVASGPPSSDEMDFLLRMLPRMKSDHYKVQTLTKVLDRASVNPAQQAMLAKAAADVESDHYAAEFLKRLSGTGTMGPEVRQAFLAAVGRIQSDHYASEVLRNMIRRQTPSSADIATVLQLAPGLQGDHYRTEVLSALLDVQGLNERDLLGIVEASRAMSDHYESETLRKAVRHRAATGAVRDAVLRAADAMSSHYGGEVRLAAGRGR